MVCALKEGGYNSTGC